MNDHFASEGNRSNSGPSVEPSQAPPNDETIAEATCSALERLLHVRQLAGDAVALAEARGGLMGALIYLQVHIGPRALEALLSDRLAEARRLAARDPRLMRSQPIEARP